MYMGMVELGVVSAQISDSFLWCAPAHLTLIQYVTLRVTFD